MENKIQAAARTANYLCSPDPWAISLSDNRDGGIVAVHPSPTLRQSLTMQPWLAYNSLCRLASASRDLELKVCTTTSGWPVCELRVMMSDPLLNPF